MNKPDFSKCETSEYYYKLAAYWEYKYHCAKVVGDECLNRLLELNEICWDDSDPPYWVASGQIVGG